MRQRVHRERLAWQQDQPREMARRQQVQDRVEQLHAPPRQQQGALLRERHVRVARFLIWHALLIWPICVNDDELARPAVCGAVICSLQLAFLMTCHRALSHLHKALFTHSGDVADAEHMCSRTVRIVIFAVVCLVVVLAVCIQLAINLANSPR